MVKRKKQPKSNKKPYWLDKKENVDKIWYALIGACALLVIADLFYHKHVLNPIEDFIPGMYGWYGLIGSIFLVLGAILLRILLMRSEDYYKRTDND